MYFKCTCILIIIFWSRLATAKTRTCGIDPGGGEGWVPLSRVNAHPGDDDDDDDDDDDGDDDDDDDDDNDNDDDDDHDNDDDFTWTRIHRGNCKRKFDQRMLRKQKNLQVK